MILTTRKFGNDLFADFNCTCPHKNYVDGPLANIMKTKIGLSGYNDDYFFKIVNKDPKIITCNCGKNYSVKWINDGVINVLIDEIK